MLPLPVPSPLRRAWVLLVPWADSPWSASLEAARRESAGLDLASRTRLHAGSRLFLQPSSRRRLFIWRLEGRSQPITPTRNNQ